MAVYIECPKRPPRTMYDLHRVVHGRDPDPDLMARQKAIIMKPLDGSMFFCGDGAEQEPFCRCGHTAELLCDFPMGRGKTCDLLVCWCCSKQIGENQDLCDIHFAEFVKRTGATRINPWPPSGFLRGSR